MPDKNQPPNEPNHLSPDGFSELFAHAIPQADQDFEDALRAQLLYRLNANSNTTSSDNGRLQTQPTPLHTNTYRPNLLHRYRMIAAALLAVMMVAGLFAAFPSLAQSLTQFFSQEETDVKNEQVAVSIDDFPTYYNQGPQEDTQPELSLEEGQALVAYPIYVPDVHGLYPVSLTVDEETQTVQQIIAVPFERSPNGQVVITFTQTPLTFYEPPTIGVSAAIEDIMVGDVQGAYVRGGYVIQSTSWEVLEGEETIPPVADSEITDPDDTVVLVDYQSVWVDNPRWQQIAWQQGNIIYSVESDWNQGLLNILAFAEKIATNEPIWLADVIGLPTGLPHEFHAWFENAAFYDDRQAVIYEYHDEDWFMFITEASPGDTIFDRPEIAEITRQNVQIGDWAGEYAEGVWEAKLPSLGSLPPLDRVSEDVIGEQTQFQWVRWSDNTVRREILVINGCGRTGDVRPCYNQDELVTLASNLITRPPGYQARRTAEALFRAPLNPVDHFQRQHLEWESGFVILTPRNISVIPWPYRFNTIQYDFNLAATWQLYSTHWGVYYPRYWVLPADVGSPAILIFQKNLGYGDVGLISGCDLPASTTMQTVFMDDQPAGLITGVWEAGSTPFVGHDTFCLEGQHFQILRWSDGPMDFEIMAIDADDVTIDHLLAIAASLE